MNSSTSFLSFLVKHGRSLSEINPGSSEIALDIDQGIEGLLILESDKQIVLGGDILTEKNGRLKYAYQVWGSEYHYLNWYCDKEDKETEDRFSKRSIDSARQALQTAKTVASLLKEKCFVVFVWRNPK